MPRLLKELEKVRAQGYAVDDEENNLGARCVAAPVFSDHGSIEAALGLSGTTQQVSAQTMPRIVEALKDSARHTSMGMGYRAPPPRRRLEEIDLALSKCQILTGSPNNATPTEPPRSE
jgi:hypothetical protein